MFWVISVYFNIRNTLPKSGTFLLGHPVYTRTCIIKKRPSSVALKNINLPLNIMHNKEINQYILIRKQARSKAMHTAGAAASSARAYIAH